MTLIEINNETTPVSSLGATLICHMAIIFTILSAGPWAVKCYNAMPYASLVSRVETGAVLRVVINSRAPNHSEGCPGNFPGIQKDLKTTSPSELCWVLGSSWAASLKVEVPFPQTKGKNTPKSQSPFCDWVLEKPCWVIEGIPHLSSEQQCHHPHYLPRQRQDIKN